MDFGRRAGDMLKSTYDPDADGTVNDSDKLEASSKAQVQDHTPKSHAHAQADVTNLAAALAGKSATGHAHTESDISDLDHDALKVKGVIVNDAAIGDQKVLAYDLATERIVYITPAPSGAVLKSIQTGKITITGTDLSDTATISSIDPAKSIVLWQATTATYATYNYRAIRVAITNATTVTATRSGLDPQGSGTSELAFTVIEFESGVHDIKNYTHPKTTDPPLTIDEVDPDKTWVIFTGSHYPSNTTISYLMPKFYLQDSTTIQLAPLWPSDYRFTVIEFD